MAHFKRKRCRTSTKGRSNTVTFYRKRHGLKPIKIPLYWRRDNHDYWPSQYSMMSGNPRWWDIVFHTRPSRARAQRLLQAVRAGRRDPDDTCWPDYRKPRSYYW